MSELTKLIEHCRQLQIKHDRRVPVQLELKEELMATVSSRRIVDEIIKGRGHYEDDPVVVRIVEYNNMFNGDLAWGLIYKDEDPDRYHKSAACINPRTIFEDGVEVGRG